MNAPKFAVACPGELCPLQDKPAGHSHMPKQEQLPNRLTVHPEVTAMASVIIQAFNGQAGDEEQAWQEYELVRSVEHELSRWVAGQEIQV